MERSGAADYIQNVIAQLIRSYAGPGTVKFKMQLEGVRLGVNVAIPCGLILTEFVSNVFKHAFPDGKKGTVEIRLRRAQGQVILEIQDDGIGMPRDLDVDKSSSFGLRLVRQLVNQLAGQLDLDRSAAGTRFTVRFPPGERPLKS